MTEEELKLLHISSKVENLICQMLRKGKIVFLTGNPGDGKTFIIKAIKDVIASTNAYTKFDMNSETEYVEVAREIAACYSEQRPAVIAINEYLRALILKKRKSRSGLSSQSISSSCRPPTIKNSFIYGLHTALI